MARKPLIPPSGGADLAPDIAPPVRRTPMSLSRRFMQICTAAAADALASEGLTPLESGVLAYLSRVSGEPCIDQISLAARMGVDRSHASLLVDRLFDRGLVDRQINPENRRAHILRLTAAGEKVHARTRPSFNAGQQKILAVLRPAERELLLDLLVRVVEGNRILARPGAGRRKRATSASTASEKGAPYA
jgi:DNA-binding MarR family transcriptional regulator